ncbi:MAG: hypothetical protein FD174_238 [Geobacteraceae bacterium]|nr:MAG: hypothetical protein FD174_238 [Geobacteraceae bacterium]
MWILRINRSQLVEIFKDGGGSWLNSYAPSYVDILPGEPCDSNNFYLVWNSQPSKNYCIPIAIIVDKEFQKDFFAWSLTYLSHISPLSSYCRIIDSNTFNSLVGCTPTNIKLPEAAYVSVIAAELLGYVDGNLGNINITHGNAYSSTFSFARVRAKFYQYRNAFPDDLSNVWWRTRALSNKKISRDYLGTLSEIWTCLDAFDNDLQCTSLISVVEPSVISALEEYSIKGVISPATIKKLYKNQIILHEPELGINGTLESRVTSVEKILSQLGNRRTNDKNISFISAYIVSQISPGTLDHFEILKPYSENFSSAYLWLGVFAGLHPQSRVFQSLGNLSNRIFRDLHRDEHILERPQSDISYVELDIISSHIKDLRSIPSRHHGYLDIEIAPFIVSTIKISRNDDNIQPDLFSKESLSNKDIQFALYELEDSLRRAEQVKKRLFSFLGGSTRGRR